MLRTTVTTKVFRREEKLVTELATARHPNGFEEVTARMQVCVVLIGVGVDLAARSAVDGLLFHFGLAVLATMDRLLNAVVHTVGQALNGATWSAKLFDV